MLAAKKPMTVSQISEVAKLFAVMSDTSRLLILQQLMAEPQTVTGLIDSTGLNQANLSKHLNLLYLHNFVDRRKEGIYVLYSIKDRTVAKLCEIMFNRLEREANRLVSIVEGYSI